MHKIGNPFARLVNQIPLLRSVPWNRWTVGLGLTIAAGAALYAYRYFSAAKPSNPKNPTPKQEVPDSQQNKHQENKPQPTDPRLQVDDPKPLQNTPVSNPNPDYSDASLSKTQTVAKSAMGISPAESLANTTSDNPTSPDKEEKDSTLPSAPTAAPSQAPVRNQSGTSTVSPGNNSYVNIQTLLSRAPHLAVKFSSVKSNQLQKLSVNDQDYWPQLDPKQFSNVSYLIQQSFRGAFHQLYADQNLDRDKVVTAYSAGLMNDQVAASLLLDRRPSAIGSKSQSEKPPYAWIDETGTKRLSKTNTRAALSSFVVQICPIQMVGDHYFHAGERKHCATYFPNNQVRPYILSTLIMPDYEQLGVMSLVTHLRPDPFEGKHLDTIPDIPEYQDTPAKRRDTIKAYDDQLTKHMVYHLTQEHQLPAIKDASKYTLGNAKEFLEMLLLEGEPSEFQEHLKNKAVHINNNDQYISLEALFNIYVHQVRTEFTALESLLPQGYVYTYDPAAIFIQALGYDAARTVLYRLHFLAIRYVAQTLKLNNLKLFAFNDFADDSAVALLKQVLPAQAIAKKGLFTDNLYNRKEDWAVVIHNNSDAFGYNIETEFGASSLDAFISNNSDAAALLGLVGKEDKPTQKVHNPETGKELTVGRRNPDALKNIVAT